MCGHCCVLVVPLHARRGLSKVAVLRAYACCSLTKGHGLTRAGCNKRSIRKKGAAVEAVLRVSRLALPFAVFLEYVKVVGPGTVCVPGPTIEGCCGGVLLSHTLPGAVPSALAGLASRFGMETGRFPAAMTTTRLVNQYSLVPQRVGVVLVVIRIVATSTL